MRVVEEVDGVSHPDRDSRPIVRVIKKNYARNIGLIAISEILRTRFAEYYVLRVEKCGREWLLNRYRQLVEP